MMRDGFRPAGSLLRALAGQTIRVGTENQAKLGAVRSAFASFVEGGDSAEILDADAVLALLPVAVDSGVSEQPIGFEQILAGARNRARAAFESGDAAMAVGIEDGLANFSGGSSEMFYNVGCAWITDGEREGHGFSSAFAYPPGCREPALAEQAPIGGLFDTLWRAHREVSSKSKSAPTSSGTAGSAQEPAKGVASGRQGGNIGLLTQGRLDRSAYGEQAVLCALVRFLHTDLYD